MTLPCPAAFTTCAVRTLAFTAATIVTGAVMTCTIMAGAFAPHTVVTGAFTARAIALMAAQPSMIKRPVLALGDRLIVGFDAANYESAIASLPRD